MTTEEIKQMIENTRSEVIKKIEELLNSHESKCADFVMNNVSPVCIKDSANDNDIYTSDVVYFAYNERFKKYEVAVDYSSSWDNDWDYARNLDVETLVCLLEEMENNPEVFNTEEEDEEENDTEMPWDYGKHFE